MLSIVSQSDECAAAAFYLGSSQVIHIEDAPHLSEGPFHYPFHAERAVLDKVRCGDRKPRKAVKSLLSEIFAKKSRLETVKRVCWSCWWCCPPVRGGGRRQLGQADLAQLSVHSTLKRVS